ncbi:GNAT family N-acetyltransferase [Litchfieldella rifensis]|uniref:GNAT family N-acetyltransferase n=1 Tax=Litchfieldella rifensis TaxID=762643 RepID=A0ABV7LK32_9GAMM
MNHSLEILRLTADSPYVATIAEWQYEQWGYLHPGETLAVWRGSLEAHCGSRGVPSVFVALCDTRPVGTASLVEDDMGERLQLTPWLASVFVVPEWRGQGIASRLVKRVEREARDVGFAHCHLFTPDQQGLYRRLGWQDHEVLTYRGEDVTIMTRLLIGSSA